MPMTLTLENLVRNTKIIQNRSLVTNITILSVLSVESDHLVNMLIKTPWDMFFAVNISIL